MAPEQSMTQVIMQVVMKATKVSIMAVTQSTMPDQNTQQQD